MTGNLIEMNAHMVRTNTSTWLMWIGIVTTIILFSICFSDCLSSNDFKRVRFYILPVLIFIAMFIYALGIPRVKEIKFCANGPVAIEQINEVYDIFKIDGKEIIVRER